MARFYVTQVMQVGAQIELSSDVVRHITVLRLRIGDEIELFNGDGLTFFAIITQIEKRSIAILINSVANIKNESPLNLILAMCLIANDKMDLTIQKATELGVNFIVPIISERSQRIDKDRLEKRLEHWRGIIINSCEQSSRSFLPDICQPIALNKFLVSYSDKQCKIIMSPHVKASMTLPKLCNDAVVLIGPEGGFAPNEVDLANSFGYKSISLGSRILRAETAAISALTLCQIHYGDFMNV